TLDAMPGRQMSIDGDLSAGLIGDVVAPDDELAERLDDPAGLPGAQDEPGAAHVEREAVQRQDEEQGRERGEVQGTRGVQSHQEHHQGRRDGEREEQVEQERRQGQHEQRDHEHDRDDDQDLPVAPHVDPQRRRGDRAHASAPCQDRPGRCPGWYPALR
ncbi:MAG: FHIPEP family type III secretion protein, partial [Gemmatimonadetes bacterium]|nr:FHIPEP family type III secretion protein [Gemmatimonadota bacterium]